MSNEVATPEPEDDKKAKKKTESQPSPKPGSEEKKKKMAEKLRKDELASMSKLLGVSGLTFADEYESVKEVFSTGHAELDRILTSDHFDKFGVGGIPRGYLVEVFGPFGGGKSSLCLMIAASVTGKGERVLWCDAEGSFQQSWSAAQGVDNSKLIRAGPNTCACGEEWLEMILTAANSGKFGLIVVDSLVGLQPKAIVESTIDDKAKMGAAGAMTGKYMPMLVKAAEKGNCSIIFIVYGNPETTPGGDALKFFSSLRIRVAPIGGKEKFVKKEGEQIGVRSNTKNVKGRFGIPQQETVLPIYFSDEKPYGIDQLLDLALSRKIIRTRTEDEVEYFSWGEIKKIQGFDKMRSLILEEGANVKALAEQVKAKGATLSAEVVQYLNDLDGDELGLDKEPAETPESDEL